MNDQVTIRISQRALRGVIALGALGVAVAGGYVAGLRADNVPLAGEQLVYAGLVAQTDGTPITGAHDVSLTVTGATDGLTCAATAPATTFTQGRFKTALSDTCANLLRKNQGGTVDVVVDGTDFGPQPIAAVPYALQVESTHDWQSFTPTLVLNDTSATAAASDTSEGEFRRVGDTLEVELRTKFNADPGGGGACGTPPCDVGWQLPGNFDPNNAKQPGGVNSFIGWATLNGNAGTGGFTFLACKIPNQSNDIKCAAEGTGTFITNSDVVASPNAFVNIHIRVPVK